MYINLKGTVVAKTTIVQRKKNMDCCLITYSANLAQNSNTSSQKERGEGEGKVTA